MPPPGSPRSRTGPAERVDDEYPLLLVTGRTLDQFNAGTMTRRSVTRQLHPTDLLQISPADATRHHVDDGALVDLESRYGSATVTATISTAVAPGQLFATFSDPATRLNQVTGPHRDPVTHTPEYKRTAVRLVAHTRHRTGSDRAPTPEVSD